jgi:hypothetical protein
MIETSETGVLMKQNWKSKVAKATGGNNNLDKKVMKIKTSWDEVEGMLNKSVKKKRK